MCFIKIAKLFGFAALTLVCPLAANPIIGGEIYVVNDGAVQATFLAGYASYSDDLLLYLPANGFGIIFNNQTTAVGTVFNLGNYTAGSELIFQIHVLNTGNVWFSGNASRNADGVAHNMVINDWGTPGITSVGFEDLVGAGDKDFDDLAFSLTNASGSAVPEPGSLVMFAMGTGMLGLLLRRKIA